MVADGRDPGPAHLDGRSQILRAWSKRLQVICVSLSSKEFGFITLLADNSPEYPVDRAVQANVLDEPPRSNNARLTMCRNLPSPERYTFRPRASRVFICFLQRPGPLGTKREPTASVHGVSYLGAVRFRLTVEK
jgi:hypothetical protein